MKFITNIGLLTESMRDSDALSGEDINSDVSSIDYENEEEETLSIRESDEEITISRTTVSRKSVRFADTCGKPLTTIRVMKEPSDYPPKLDPEVCFINKLITITILFCMQNFFNCFFFFFLVFCHFV